MRPRGITYIIGLSILVWCVVFSLVCSGCGMTTRNAWNIGKFELGAEASIGGKHKHKEVDKSTIVGPDGKHFDLIPEQMPEETRENFFRRLFKRSSEG